MLFSASFKSHDNSAFRLSLVSRYFLIWNAISSDRMLVLHFVVADFDFFLCILTMVTALFLSIMFTKLLYILNHILVDVHVYYFVRTVVLVLFLWCVLAVVHVLCGYVHTLTCVVLHSRGSVVYMFVGTV